MLKIQRTDSDNPDFKMLVNLLDQELKIFDGDDHAFYDQFNKIDKIQHVVMAYKDNQPAGCGAIKAYEKGVVEVKRMFVLETFRGQGIAKRVLFELENWAKELNYKDCILETGKKQTDAIGLYGKMGYKVITNYGQYEGVENSICMQKSL